MLNKAQGKLNRSAKHPVHTLLANIFSDNIEYLHSYFARLSN